VKPGRTISRVQALQFELLKAASFNAFDGARVVRDLRSNRALWCGVVMERPDSLIQLREIGQNFWSVDTLYILSSAANDAKLRALSRTWQPDAVDWITGHKAQELLGSSASGRRILALWWD
jgi:hypothetical protein